MFFPEVCTASTRQDAERPCGLVLLHHWQYPLFTRHLYVAYVIFMYICISIYIYL